MVDNYGIILVSLCMAINTHSEPPALTAAKQKYGDGIWEYQLRFGRGNWNHPDGKRKLLGVDRRTLKTRKFWPYKKWILVDGKWLPSIEMPD